MASSSDQSTSSTRAHLNVKPFLKLTRGFGLGQKPNVDVILRGSQSFWPAPSDRFDALSIRASLAKISREDTSVLPFLAMVRGPVYKTQGEIVDALERELNFPSVRLALMPLLQNPSEDPVKVLVEYINNISNDVLALKDQLSKLETQFSDLKLGPPNPEGVVTPSFVFPLDPDVLSIGECPSASASYRTKIQVEDERGVTRVFELTLLSGHEGSLRPSNYLSVRFRDLGRSGCEIIYSIRTYDGRVSWSNSSIGGPCAHPPSIKEILSLFNTLTNKPVRGCAIS